MADGLPLGELIARARGRRRPRAWTQQELADRVGVDRKTVDNWENHRTRPSRATIARIEDVLGESLTVDSEAEEAARNREMLHTSIDRLNPDQLAEIRKALDTLRNGKPHERAG